MNLKEKVSDLISAFEAKEREAARGVLDRCGKSAGLPSTVDFAADPLELILGWAYSDNKGDAAACSFPEAPTILGRFESLCPFRRAAGDVCSPIRGGGGKASDDLYSLVNSLAYCLDVEQSCILASVIRDPKDVLQLFAKASETASAIIRRLRLFMGQAQPELTEHERWSEAKSLKEWGKVFGVTGANTVKNWINAGKIRAEKVGSRWKVLNEDVEKYQRVSHS